MLSTGRSNMYPFTPTQWQELEHQALIYKYMASGIPVPPDLLLPIRSSYFLNAAATAPTLQPHFPQQSTLGWSCYGYGGRKAEDPEPGRCRRTDGKKWRCSKEAYPDSKYCERHMHRGKNRSRKPVEISLNNNNRAAAAAAHESSYYPHPYYNKEAYPDAPAGGGGGGGSAWELRPLGLGEPKRSISTHAHGDYYNEEEEEKKKKHCFVLGADFKLGSSNGGEEDQRPLRRFFDEWPQKSRDDSWMLSSPKTQLSISIPMALHPSQLINGSCERGL